MWSYMSLRHSFNIRTGKGEGLCSLFHFNNWILVNVGNDKAVNYLEGFHQ